MDVDADLSVEDGRGSDVVLVDAVARLVEEFPEFPAGTILICFERTVRKIRARGCSTRGLPEEAEQQVRELVALYASPTLTRPWREAIISRFEDGQSQRSARSTGCIDGDFTAPLPRDGVSVDSDLNVDSIRPTTDCGTRG